MEKVGEEPYFAWQEAWFGETSVLRAVEAKGIALDCRCG